MPRNAANILVPPLFYDVLSGEFQPPSDPEHRVHSLGRLAYRAYELGTEIKRDNRFSDIHTYTYTPSWAQDVEARVSVDYLFEPNLSIISRLFLRSAIDDVLKVYHFSANGYQLAGVNNDRNNVKLELGQPLDGMRDQVTQLAQDFFDKVEK